MTDLSGQTFGRLTVTRYGSFANGRPYWLCRCTCGRHTVALATHLVAGHIRSCGCLRVEQARKRLTKHGLYGTPVYRTWARMIGRCTNSNHPRYATSGGKGVRVCPRWREFEHFYADMGPQAAGTRLGRTSASRDYEPANCRWVVSAARQAAVKA